VPTTVPPEGPAADRQPIEGDDEPRTLVVLCAPGIGMLEHWLPILAHARATHPGWRLIALVPDTRTLADVDARDTVIGMVDELLDVAVAPGADGALLAADGLVAVQQLALRGGLARGARRGIDALRWRLTPSSAAGAPPRVAAALLRALMPHAAREARFALERLAPDTTRLLYDIYVQGKPALRPILDGLAGVPRFSLHHGIDVVVPAATPAPPPDPAAEAHTYLYAEAERAAYRHNHGLDPAALEVVGIPRHEPAWLEQVVTASRARHDVTFQGAVLVISRPAGSSYLPRERKIAALRALHQVVCVELGLRLVIKPHPKEGEDGTIAAALPAEEEGQRWQRSAAHPFHLARHSVAAVAFHSGVVVDMLALGVPVVELIDVRGLAEHDRPGVARDADGRPQFSSFRRAGMVLAAHDSDELGAALRRILAAPEVVLEELRAARDRVFAPCTGAIGRIVDDLAEPWPGPHR
jgi:hypothetical protein